MIGQIKGISLGIWLGIVLLSVATAQAAPPSGSLPGRVGALEEGLNAEEVARVVGDNALEVDLNLEAETRTAADTNLQAQIDTLAIGPTQTYGALQSRTGVISEVDLGNNVIRLLLNPGQCFCPDQLLTISIVTDTAIFDVNGMPDQLSTLGEGDKASIIGVFRGEGDLVVFEAFIIELGPEGAFQKLTSTATSAVDINDQFDTDVDSGQGLTTPLNLTVQIQNGTKLINRNGQTVNKSEIRNGRLVEVDGVLDVNTDTLFAALVVIDVN